MLGILKNDFEWETLVVKLNIFYVFNTNLYLWIIFDVYKSLYYIYREWKMLKSAFILRWLQHSWIWLMRWILNCIFVVKINDLFLSIVQGQYFLLEAEWDMTSVRYLFKFQSFLSINYVRAGVENINNIRYYFLFYFWLYLNYFLGKELNLNLLNLRKCKFLINNVKWKLILSPSKIKAQIGHKLDTNLPALNFNLNHSLNLATFKVVSIPSWPLNLKLLIF